MKIGLEVIEILEASEKSIKQKGIPISLYNQSGQKSANHIMNKSTDKEIPGRLLQQIDHINFIN